MLSDHVDNLRRADLAGIRQVVDSEWYFARPACDAAFCKLSEVRQTVGRLQERVVSHHLADVVAAGIILVKRNSESPDVAVCCSDKQFFTERLAAGIEAAVVLPE